MQNNGVASLVPLEAPDRYVSNINPSGIEPTEFRVLIKPKEVENKIGNIHIPDVVQERDQFAQMEGLIVAISPLAFTYERWPEGARKPEVGDRVLFGKYSGAIVKGKDRVDYRLVSDKDIGAILVD